MFEIVSLLFPDMFTRHKAGDGAVQVSKYHYHIYIYGTIYLNRPEYTTTHLAFLTFYAKGDSVVVIVPWIML